MTVVDATVTTAAAASSVVLRAVDITKSFDGLLALKGVNFDDPRRRRHRAVR